MQNTQSSTDKIITDLVSACLTYINDTKVTAYNNIINDLEINDGANLSLMSTKAKAELIQEKEVTGITGFDCGWVYFTIHEGHDSELQTKLRKILRAKPVDLTDIEIAFKQMYDVIMNDYEVKLEPRYFLPVQSITIKGMEAKVAKEPLGKLVVVSSVYD